MSKFDELNLNLNKVLQTLISSQNLCKLLTVNSATPLTTPDITDTTTLLFDKIYPIPKIPDVQSEADSIVTVIFDEIRSGTNLGYKDSVICFNVMCHLDIWKMDNGILRPYSIMNEIDKLFNNERVVGIGKLQFKRSPFIFINTKYAGFRMDYVVTDFNW